MIKARGEGIKNDSSDKDGRADISWQALKNLKAKNT